MRQPWTMDPRTRRSDRQLGVAAVTAVVALLLAATELGIYLARPPLTFGGPEAATELWQYLTEGPVLAVTGLLILARRASRTVGWLLLGSAVPFTTAACLSTWLRFATTVTPGVHAAVYAEYGLWEVPRLALTLLPLCIPYGRFLGARRRAAALLAVAVLANEVNVLLAQPVWQPGTTRFPNALLVPGWVPVSRVITHPLELLIVVGLLLGALSPLAYLRDGTAVQRRQIAVVVPVFVLWLTEEVVRTFFNWSPWVIGGKVILGVLVSTALAYTIVRDRLHDIDRAARRVIGVAVPIALLAAVYASAAAAMSLLPAGGAAGPAALAVLAALAGLVLRPASGWVLRRVDGFLYGDRAEPYQLARLLAGSLRDSVGAAQVPLAVCQIVVSALRLPGAALTAETPAGTRCLATVGDDSGGDPVPLRYQGQTVGHLIVRPRSGQDELDELDLAALQPLADIAAPAVSAILLAEALESSRAEVVTVREHERSRLRRDVHDGVGPSLAAVRLLIDTAHALLPAGSAGGTLLARASVELGAAVTEFRRVTDGLRPSVLDDRGLAGALAELTARMSTPVLPIVLDVPAALPPCGSAAELAAYRIAAEALANAIRHARATRIRVSLRALGGQLVLRIVDDGSGTGGDRNAGTGLGSMARRAADLGGCCTVDHSAGGTTVTALLPLVTTAQPGPRVPARD